MRALKRANPLAAASATARASARNQVLLSQAVMARAMPRRGTGRT